MNLNSARSRTAASLGPKPLANHELAAANALRYFPELVRQLGGDPKALLREVGIDPAVLGKPHSMIAYGSLADALEAAATRLSCADFGLRLAAMHGDTISVEPIGVVMENSKTLGQAMEYAIKYSRAQSLPVRVRLEQNRNSHEVFVWFEFLCDGTHRGIQAAEHALLLGSLNVLKLSNGAARVRQVLFSHAPQSAPATYRTHFGCQVLFLQNLDGLALTDSDLLCPISDPDARVYEMATSFIEARYAESAVPLAESIRRLIRAHLGHRKCTVESIATELCMHPRTLRRHLSAEGTSFASVKDEVRREVAMRYIREDSMTLKRLAELLDYAETSVLARSFRRWFSATPHRLRLELKSSRINDF